MSIVYNFIQNFLFYFFNDNASLEAIPQKCLQPFSRPQTPQKLKLSIVVCIVHVAVNGLQKSRLVEGSIFNVSRYVLKWQVTFTSDRVAFRVKQQLFWMPAT